MADSVAEHGQGWETGGNRCAMGTRAAQYFGKKGEYENGHLASNRTTNTADRKDRNG